KRLPGIVLATIVAAIAMLLGRIAPLVGGPVIAIVLGIFLGSRGIPKLLHRPGLAFAGRHVLQISIVCLGFGLNLDQVMRVGFESIAVTLATLVTAFFTAWLLGRWLQVPDKLQIL